jgi:hypothetical protein
MSGYGPAPLRITSIDSGVSGETAQLSGVLTTALWPTLDDAEFNEVRFVLTNFHEYRGSSVRPAGDRLAMGARKWELETERYEVKIDLRKDYKKIIAATKSEGGVGLTHVGSIGKADGRPFNSQDVKSSRGASYYFLGLARGFWVEPGLPCIGDGGSGHVVYGPFRLTPWQSARAVSRDVVSHCC